MWSWRVSSWLSMERTPANPAARCAGLSPLGNSHRPPKRPLSRRLATRSLPLRSTRTATSSMSGKSTAARRGGMTGKRATRFSLLAIQCDATGQARQLGLRGVHTRAPSSMRPWLKADGSAAGTSSVARAHSRRCAVALRMGSSIPSRRASTRATLPSTRGARRPNAIDAMAPAVYRPMPGTENSSSTWLGTLPQRAITSFAPA